MRQSGEIQTVLAISYKEKMKKHHDLKIEKESLWLGIWCFYTIFRLCWFPGKLKSKWTGPYLITQLFSHGEVELKTKEGVWFKVNGQRIKIYFGYA